MDAVICVVLIVYIVLGIRWGIRYIDGRWAWLEQPTNRVVKWIVAVGIGIVFGIFGMLARVMKFILVDLPAMMR